MRLHILIPCLALAACDPAAPPDEITLCDDLVTADAGCMTDQNYQQCLEAVETCGDGVLIMESCPLQFGC